ncbi:uncharacterized protein LOC141811959 [Curcuma longa]|uniref:uncharacterized protein LOC141811959 n=1 Tax=Curcuma longa TaxID=136217 RepID=UPI003D9FA2B2
MLESVSESVNRFAPPPPRNRSLNRRKSGDRYDKPNYSYGLDGEKSQASYSKNFTAVERGEIPLTNIAKVNTHSKLIPLEGCSSSEAVQFLSERWAAAVHLLDDPATDVHERPVVYSGASGSSWVHAKLPHQIDFIGDLQRKIQKADCDAGLATSIDG